MRYIAWRRPALPATLQRVTGTEWWAVTGQRGRGRVNEGQTVSVTSAAVMLRIPRHRCTSIRSAAIGITRCSVLVAS